MWAGLAGFFMVVVLIWVWVEISGTSGTSVGAASGDDDETALGAVGPVDRKTVGCPATSDGHVHLADKLFSIVLRDIVITVRSELSVREAWAISAEAGLKLKDITERLA